MSLPCPYCQSRDTVLLESPQHLVSNSNLPSAQNNVMSPLALATLGISVSKSLNIPPIAGALFGVLIGGIWMLVTEDEVQSNSHPVYTRHYYCNDCDRDFSPSIRNGFVA